MNTDMYWHEEKFSLGYALCLFLLLACFFIPASIWHVHQLPELWFYDDVEHVLGGAFIFAACGYVCRRKHLSPVLFFFLCLGVAALVGIFWEAWWYYFRKVATGTPELFITLDDTISDLLYDIGGGFLSWFIRACPPLFSFSAQQHATA